MSRFLTVQPTGGFCTYSILDMELLLKKIGRLQLVLTVVYTLLFAVVAPFSMAASVITAIILGYPYILFFLLLHFAGMELDGSIHPLEFDPEMEEFFRAIMD